MSCGLLCVLGVKRFGLGRGRGFWRIRGACCRLGEVGSGFLGGVGRRGGFGVVVGFGLGLGIVGGWGWLGVVGGVGGGGDCVVL